jgi:hypothetical protein
MPYQLPSGTVYPTELLRQKSQQAAEHRRHLRTETKQGTHTFSELMALVPADPTLRKTRVKAALSWLPSVGAVKVARILKDTGVSPLKRLGGLTQREQDELLRHPYLVQNAAAVAHARRKAGAA